MATFTLLRTVRLWAGLFTLTTLISAWGPIPALGQTCSGDCDGSGEVTVDELVKAVNIALGTAALDACGAADRSGDGAVTVDELVVSVNGALNGCPEGSPSPSPTPTPTNDGTPTATASPASTAAVTPTFGVPNGIFWHPASSYQYTRLPATEISFFVFYLAVDGMPESTAQVTLSGPGGSVSIPFSGQATLDNRVFAQYYNGDPGLAYTPGASYTVTTVTSLGTASAVVTAPGDITIAPDGSQVSWAHDGNNEQILVYTPGFTPAFDSGMSDKASPFLVPVSAYGAGPGTYKVTARVRRTSTAVSGGAPGSGVGVYDERLGDVVPAAVGVTHTPTKTSTTTPTRTLTPTVTPTPTITGTIPPTPVLTGQILFKSSRPGSDGNVSHIFVMAADGANVVQVTTGAGFDDSPQWNVAKTKVAFTRDRRLHVMNADGSGITPLRTQNFQYDPTFSPDGTRIVYEDSDFSKTNLFSYELGTGQVTQLTSGSWNDAYPTFSPDGAHIYFTSTRDSRFGEIYRMNADGSDVVRVTTNESYELLGEVSPDGSQLVYTARVAQGLTDLVLTISNVDGSNPVQLPSGPAAERPLWSPDGSYIVYRPFVASRSKIYRLQANGLFTTDLSNNDSYEIAGDWR